MKIKKRNPIAKDLRTPKYRPRVEKDPDLYTRKTKHKKSEEEIPKGLSRDLLVFPLFLPLCKWEIKYVS